MRHAWISTCLALTLLAVPAFATDQEQKQKVAEDKAQVLEHKAAENSGPAAVPKSASHYPA